MNVNELEAALEGRAAEEAQTPEEPVLEETPAPVEAETVPEPEQSDETLIETYLAKYGGDRDAALKAAAHQSSLVGRQGNEIGELKQQLQEMNAKLFPEIPDAPYPNYEPLTDETVSWADQMAYDDNWQQAAEWAVQHQPMLYERIINQRSQIDPVAVNRFETSMALRAQQAMMQQQLQPIVAPVIAQQGQQQFTQAWNQVAEKYPDLPEYSQQFVDVAASRPHLLSALQNSTPEVRAQVIEDIYLLTKGLGAGPVSTATAQAVQATQDGAAALRRQAAVGTTTMAAPSPETRADGHLDPWRAAFREEAGLPTGDD